MSNPESPETNPVLPVEEISGKYLIFPPGSVHLLGEATSLSSEQVAEMLTKMSNGDWGNVAELFQNSNNDFAHKKNIPETYNLWGKYSVGESAYEVYVSTRKDEAGRVSIISASDGKKMSQDLMGTLMSPGVKGEAE